MNSHAAKGTFPLVFFLGRASDPAIGDFVVA